jgi:hypothetical protein
MAEVEGEALQNHGERHLDLEQHEVLVNAAVRAPYEREKLRHLADALKIPLA